MSGQLVIPLRHISGALLALGLLISACSPRDITPGNPVLSTAIAAPSVVATMIPQPTATSLPPTAEGPTQTPPTQPATADASAPAQVTLDLTGVAQSAAPQVIDAVPANAGGSPWETAAQYTQVDLQGYPVTGHLMKPQIFVYALDRLAENENASRIVANLKALLDNQQTGQYLPYLPIYNAQQVLHAKVRFLDFKNGKGVSYLTQFDQAFIPINNHELHYTFQGLTSDGKYYVAAVLPVNLPGLPKDENITGTGISVDDFTNNFVKYLADTTQMLDKQPADVFLPDLSKLDAAMQSMEVK